MMSTASYATDTASMIDTGFEPAPTHVPVPPPAPVAVLAPYFGLVAGILCALGGGWLLLAPYAFDYRRGAVQVPRATTVDLGTGAAIVAVSLSSAALFAFALVSRLRAEPDGGPGNRPELGPGLGPEPEGKAEPEPGSVFEPEPEPVPPATDDPGGALRDLLRPLVAALAADLRSHEQERTRRAERHDPEH
jgi:hypothetical protein